MKAKARIIESYDEELPVGSVIDVQQDPKCRHIWNLIPDVPGLWVGTHKVYNTYAKIRLIAGTIHET